MTVDGGEVEPDQTLRLLGMYSGPSNIWIGQIAHRIPQYAPRNLWRCSNIRNETMVNPGIGIVTVRRCTYKLDPIGFLNRPQNAAVIGLQSLGGIARIGITLLAVRRYAIGQICH